MIGLIALAFATDQACTSCCTAAGVDGCVPELMAVGEGSQIMALGGGAWQVEGAWVVTCNGQATFDADRIVRVSHPPQDAELIAPWLNPLQIHCFRQACTFPGNLCVSAADAQGNYFLQDCRTGVPANTDDLRMAPRPTALADTVVVIDGKPLVATMTTGNPPTSAGTNSSTNNSTSAAPAGNADLAAALTQPLPRDATDPCQPPADSIRAQARGLVEQGDERRLKKDYVMALNQYKAAITMDSCNPYAWAGIGEIAAMASRPDIAIRALRNTTRLMPAHYGAWTQLGQQYEAIGQDELALAAFRAALAVRPEHPPAVEGYRRTVSAD